MKHVEKLVEPYVEAFVQDIRECPRGSEISIPLSVYNHNFSEKVLDLCKKAGVNYRETRKTKEYLCVTGDSNRVHEDKLVLIVIQGAAKSGRTTLLNSLNETYDKYDSYYQYRDGIQQLQGIQAAFSSKRNAAVVVPDTFTVRDFEGIIQEFKPIVIWIRTSAGR